ncbi:MAG: hypothetical protein AAF745_04870, partial [Planctomycetota bacterium]
TFVVNKHDVAYQGRVSQGHVVIRLTRFVSGFLNEFLQSLDDSPHFESLGMFLPARLNRRGPGNRSECSVGSE